MNLVAFGDQQTACVERKSVSLEEVCRLDAAHLDTTDSPLFMRVRAFLNALALLLVPTLLLAAPVPVHYREGSVHGYLALRTLDGKIIASGDLVQKMVGDRVISHLVYRFKDGSIDDEKAVFTQHNQFRLLSDQHIQKGPFFPKPMNVLIRTETGEVTVRYWERGQEKVETNHLDLPPDLANGIILDVIKNVPQKETETQLSYLAATPKLRLIKLTVMPAGSESFRSAGASRKANRLTVKADLGGIAGLIAPLIGKQPADGKVWIGTGEVPAFIRAEQPLYLGGPLVRTELTSPVWR